MKTEVEEDSQRIHWGQVVFGVTDVFFLGSDGAAAGAAEIDYTDQRLDSRHQTLRIQSARCVSMSLLCQDESGSVELSVRWKWESKWVPIQSEVRMVSQQKKNGDSMRILVLMID